MIDGIPYVGSLFNIVQELEMMLLQRTKKIQRTLSNSVSNSNDEIKVRKKKIWRKKNSYFDFVSQNRKGSK